MKDRVEYVVYAGKDNRLDLSQVLSSGAEVKYLELSFRITLGLIYLKESKSPERSDGPFKFPNVELNDGRFCMPDWMMKTVGTDVFGIAFDAPHLVLVPIYEDEPQNLGLDPDAVPEEGKGLPED